MPAPPPLRLGPKIFRRLVLVLLWLVTLCVFVPPLIPLRFLDLRAITLDNRLASPVTVRLVDESADPTYPPRILNLYRVRYPSIPVLDGNLLRLGPNAKATLYGDSDSGLPLPSHVLLSNNGAIHQVGVFTDYILIKPKDLRGAEPGAIALFQTPPSESAAKTIFVWVIGLLAPLDAIRRGVRWGRTRGRAPPIIATRAPHIRLAGPGL